MSLDMTCGCGATVSLPHPARRRQLQKQRHRPAAAAENKSGRFDGHHLSGPSYFLPWMDHISPPRGRGWIPTALGQMGPTTAPDEGTGRRQHSTIPCPRSSSTTSARGGRAGKADRQPRGYQMAQRSRTHSLPQARGSQPSKGISISLTSPVRFGKAGLERLTRTATTPPV